MNLRSIVLGPELQGKLVKLKPRTTEYADCYLQHFLNPNVTKFLGSNKVVPTVEDEIAYLDDSARSESSIHWAILFEGNCVGSISIVSIDWTLRHCEAGLFIGVPRLWRKGLSSDAAECVIEHIFAEYPMDFIRARYYQGNDGSESLLKSLAFEESGRLKNGLFAEGKMHDQVIMQLARKSWLNLLR